MKIVKNALKNILNSLGYSIKKHAGEELAIPKEPGFKTFGFHAYDIKTVLDIGANEGQFIRTITPIFPDAHLHCFEPLSSPFNFLELHYRPNPNITLYQFALGNAEEELVINSNEYSPSSSFLKMDDEHKINFNYAIETEPSTVKVKRLDDLGLHLNQPVLIKIDVQGFEDKVIEGGINTIGNAKIVIVEVSFKQLYENQPLFDHIYQVLRKLGFSYHGNFDQLISPVTGEILQADAIFIK